MDKNQWKISINLIDASLLAKVYIYRFIGESIQWVEIKSPDVIVHTEIYKYGAEELVKPSFICPKEDATEIAKGFIEYGKSQGFKNSEETFVKGKLEATEKHLEDMRTLVFKVNNHV